MKLKTNCLTSNIVAWIEITAGNAVLTMCLSRLFSTVRNARPDPFALLSPQLTTLRADLLNILVSGHPALSEITKYYFLHRSKQVRPVLVLLFSQATNGLGGDWSRKLSESRGQEELNRPLTRPDVLNDWNPSMPNDTARFNSSFALRPAKAYHRFSPQEDRNGSTTAHTGHLAHMILPTQLRLAQIVEMLHTASLLHDDVIDGSALRRGAPSAPASFSNKLSVLGGNFVLGRASAALARLGDEEVTELIASILSNLVDGEILQLKEVKLEEAAAAAGSESPAPTASRAARSSREAWSVYLQKTYLKTASMMAKGARAAVVLGGCKEGEIYKEIAYAYGRNLGIAFQVSS